MKILLVLTYYRPHWTGLTQYAARLAEGLAGQGHQIEVLCSQHDSNLPREEKIKGVEVFRIPYLFRFLRTVIMPGFPWAFWRRLGENDLAVIYLPLQEVLLLTLMAKIRKKRLYLVHNGDLVLPAVGGLKNRLIEKAYDLMTGLAMRLSEAVVVQTKDYSRHSCLLPRFENKWRVILPLYSIPNISPQEMAAFRQKYRLEKKTLIGFSGRFVEEKGVDFLLRSIPLIIEEIPNAHFVFAGEYKIKYEKFWEIISPLIEANKKNITLLGLLSEKDLYSFYKSLDVLVQPSRTDCFPSSQVEALLSGVPSVCTDIPGARWAVKESGMGRLVRPQDPAALAEGIIKVVRERKKYQKNFKRVLKIFSYPKTLSCYEELFRKG
jgi:glycosyltransferase involved in cell wall biosynthesis